MSVRRTFRRLSKSLRKLGNYLMRKLMPKHEPTTSYFHIVRQLAKCMMISDEINRHDHSSYTGKTAPSSNVNVTDEDESKEIIVHKTLSKNKSKDVIKSECNIVYETLSQNNFTDVPDNAIAELKDDENKKHSVIENGTSYFNILERGRNIFDKLDVTYQRVFMVSPLQEGYYTSPEQERYYDQLTKCVINSNVGSDGTINNDNLYL